MRKDIEEYLCISGAGLSIEQTILEIQEGLLSHRIAKDVVQTFISRFPKQELVEKVGELLGEVFDEEEIAKLREWAQSKTGRKSLEQMPIIIQKVSMLGQDLAAKVANDMEEEGILWSKEEEDDG